MTNEGTKENYINITTYTYTRVLILSHEFKPPQGTEEGRVYGLYSFNSWGGGGGGGTCLLRGKIARGINGQAGTTAHK